MLASLPIGEGNLPAPSAEKLAAPFAATAIIALFSWLISKVVDRRIEQFSKEMNAKAEDVRAMADWSIDVAQSFSAFLVPLLGLEILFHSGIEEWVVILYGASALVGLAATFIALSREDPVVYFDKLPASLPPAAVAGFVINAAACVVVLVFSSA